MNIGNSLNLMIFKRSAVFVLGWAKAAEWLGPLVMRLFFGYFWVINGWGKIHDLQGFAQRFIGWGIPYPHLSAVLSAYTELIGGSLLILGLLTRVATLPMMFNMLVAIATVTSKQMHGLNDFVLSDEPLYILILFWLLMTGPGKASFDSLIRFVVRADIGMRNSASPERRDIDLLQLRDESRLTRRTSSCSPAPMQ